MILIYNLATLAKARDGNSCVLEGYNLTTFNLFEGGYFFVTYIFVYRGVPKSSSNYIFTTGLLNHQLLFYSYLISIPKNILKI